MDRTYFVLVGAPRLEDVPGSMCIYIHTLGTNISILDRPWSLPPMGSSVPRSTWRAAAPAAPAWAGAARPTLACQAGLQKGRQKKDGGFLPIPRPPNVPLLRALWSLVDGTWGVLKGSWGVLVL